MSPVTAASPVTAPTPSVARRVSAWLHGHPRVRLALLLALPLLWLVVVYLGAGVIAGLVELFLQPIQQFHALETPQPKVSL